MKFNNRVINHHSYLTELTRRDLLGKSKKQSKARYTRSAGYKPTFALGDINIDVRQLLQTGRLIIKVPQGKEKQYVVYVAFDGFLDRLARTIKASSKPPFINLDFVRSVLLKAIDDGNLYIDCSCPDFRYRFAFWATKFDYKYGKPETRPPKITNPTDNIGAVCKHISGTLRDKSRLTKKTASLVNDAIKKYPEDFRKAMHLKPDEFIVNDRAGRQIKSYDYDVDDGEV